MRYNVYTNLKGDIPMNKEFYEINSTEYEEALEILSEIAEEDENKWEPKQGRKSLLFLTYYRLETSWQASIYAL